MLALVAAMGCAAARIVTAQLAETCAQGAESAQLTLRCAPGGVITAVSFAEYGQLGSGSCPGAKGSCGTDISKVVATDCVGKSSCGVLCSHSLDCCQEGKGTCCGCRITADDKKMPFVNMTDPCPGKHKEQGVQISCNNSSPLPSNATFVSTLRVNSLDSPITIDDPRPHFSFRINAAGKRAVVSEGYEIIVGTENGQLLWTSGKVTTNQTTYIKYGGVENLTSDKTYKWSVRSFPGPTAWANATFSTALIEQNDWAKAKWIQSPGGDSPGQFASQMRKVFTLPAGLISRGRVFVALPGYGEVSINGQRVDDPATGSRSLSQYDVRMLYHSYDCTHLLKPGQNVIAVYVGLGWWGHPAVPPQAQRFPYGPPTLRVLLRATSAPGQSLHSGVITEIGTDGTWQQTNGPVVYDDEYNGQTVDARMETPGWTTDTEMYPMGGSSVWTPVELSGIDGVGSHGRPFALNSTRMSSAAFQPIKVITERQPEWMKSPSLGTYVYDFGQNEPGWCKLKITGQRGLTVQLRHAEVLQHPPYGPADGNIYVANLRSAKATDSYILKGDPAGEEIAFSFTQHGFRYVELTFPGAKNQPAPTLETLTAINVRSSVALAGDLTFSDEMLQKVHHNYLWGQASNLMMVPSDCDNRDERFGWTGDSALTADEASVNFDLSSFYDNWARMLDDSSQNGAVSSWVPGGPGHSSPAAGASADASWGSAFPSVVYAQYKWQGDVLGPLQRWKGVTRFIDNEYSRTKTGIKHIFTGPGDWVPPPRSPDNPAFEPEKKVDGACSAGFSFVNDVAHVAEMAAALGQTDATKYAQMHEEVLSKWHQAWWNETNGYYASGGQSAQVFALALGAPPTTEIKQKTVDYLVQNIHAHGNHTTCGIIGWRYQLEVLSNNGHADLAYALMTQTTYPSIGYEILSVEPATTLWELWNSDVDGPGMNSRNHIMFGGNGVWLHTYIGGINNAPGTSGYKHLLISPPAALIKTAMADISFGATVHSGTSSPPLTWSSATKDTPQGEAALFWRVGNNTLSLDVAVPPNSKATTLIETGLVGASAKITEGGKLLWSSGKYVPGVEGVYVAAQVGAAVAIEHGSGSYAFQLA